MCGKTLNIFLVGGVTWSQHSDFFLSHDIRDGSEKVWEPQGVGVQDKEAPLPPIGRPREVCPLFGAPEVQEFGTVSSRHICWPPRRILFVGTHSTKMKHAGLNLCKSGGQNYICALLWLFGVCTESDSPWGNNRPHPGSLLSLDAPESLFFV